VKGWERTLTANITKKEQVEYNNIKQNRS
jgi:hypothetical protein